MQCRRAVLGLSVLVFGATLAAHAATSPNRSPAQRGRVLFVEKGCYACHGYVGQGGVTGPKLAPDPLDLEALKGFIRNSAGTAMPAYSEHLVSDAEAADIHAWLASQPKPRDHASIPLLAR